MRLLISVSHVGISDVAEFFANSRLISTFLLHSKDLLFCRVLASICEAKPRLCADYHCRIYLSSIFLFRSLLKFSYIALKVPFENI